MKDQVYVFIFAAHLKQVHFVAWYSTSGVHNTLSSGIVFGCEEVVYFEVRSSVLESGKLKPGTKKEIDDGSQNIFKEHKEISKVI